MHGIVCHSQNSSSDALFDSRTSNRLLIRLAGSGSSEYTISRMVSGTVTRMHSVRSGVASASRYRCSRSARSRRRVPATASSTCVLALISRPCSSQVYQVMPTPASRATSSRRSPGVRRRGPGARPTSSGRTLARRALRNRPSSARTGRPGAARERAWPEAAAGATAGPSFTMPSDIASSPRWRQLSQHTGGVGHFGPVAADREPGTDRTSISRLSPPPGERPDSGDMTTTTQVSARPAEGAQQPASGRWLMLIILLGGQFMALLDVTIVNVAMPTIGRTLHASGAALQLVVAGYTVSYAMLLITGARLGELYGRRRLFLAGVTVFTLSSLACGLAPGIGVLIGARF